MPITSEPQGARTEQRELSLRQACEVARTAADYRGQDTVVLDLGAVTPIVDFFVITTATSRRQMHAIADEVSRVLSEQGSRRLGQEGYEGESWVLQDFGDIVLHVFSSEARRIYDLEHLWADAARVDWAAIVGRAPTNG